MKEQMEKNVSRLLRCVVLNAGPWIKYDTKGKTSNVRGPFYMFIEEIIRSLNMNYSTVVYRSNIPGVRLPNGTWTGMLGSLQREEMDVVIPIAPILARKEIIYYSNEVLSNTGIILGASFPPGPPDLTALVMAFDKYIWIGLFVSVVVLVLVSGVYVQRDAVGGIKICTIGKQAYYTLASYFLAALFMEGTPRDPTLAVGRVMYGIWWLVMLVLANGFSGHIRAMMMAPKEVFKVNSLEELSEHSHNIQPITWKSSAYEDYFRFGQTIVNKKIWKAIQIGNGSKFLPDMFTPEIVRRMSQGHAVIVSGLLTTQALVGRQCSELDIGNMYFGRETFYGHTASCGFRKGLDAKLLKLINMRIRWQFESYIYQHWLESETWDFDRCMAPTTIIEEMPLRMKDTKDIFLMYLACLFGGLLALTFEISTTYDYLCLANKKLITLRDKVLLR